MISSTGSVVVTDVVSTQSGVVHGSPARQWAVVKFLQEGCVEVGNSTCGIAGVLLRQLEVWQWGSGSLSTVAHCARPFVALSLSGARTSFADLTVS
jgi:hypothetical protein